MKLMPLPDLFSVAATCKVCVAVGSVVVVLWDALLRTGLVLYTTSHPYKPVFTNDHLVAAIQTADH